MTLKFNDIYIKDSAVVAGPYLKDGPLVESFMMGSLHLKTVKLKN